VTEITDVIPVVFPSGGQIFAVFENVCPQELFTLNIKNKTKIA
jgi:hypothetical protein